MLNKLLIIRLTTNTQHFRICKQHLGEKRYLCELPCVVKEETMDSIDSALDEIFSSFLHEFLSVFEQDFEQVSDFFHLRIQLKYYRPFAEECHNLSCLIFFEKGKYSRLTKNLMVN